VPLLTYYFNSVLLMTLFVTLQHVQLPDCCFSIFYQVVCQTDCDARISSVLLDSNTICMELHFTWRSSCR